MKKIEFYLFMFYMYILYKLRSNNIVYHIKRYENRANLGLIEEKIKNYIFKYNFGKTPGICFVNNGKDFLTVDSLKKLYYFINKA